jgi:hypothetical protein
MSFGCLTRFRPADMAGNKTSMRLAAAPSCWRRITAAILRVHEKTEVYLFVLQLRDCHRL